MRKFVMTLTLAFAFLGLSLGIKNAASAVEFFTLKSPDVVDGQTAPDWMMYNGNDCLGENRVPTLQWENPPKGTESYALTVFDPDANAGKGWMHWFVLNIPGDATSLSYPLPEGAVQVPNSFGHERFGGACPPRGSGPHHYIFTLYAMRTKTVDYPLNGIGQNTSVWLNREAIRSTSLTLLYQREVER